MIIQTILNSRQANQANLREYENKLSEQGEFHQPEWEQS